MAATATNDASKGLVTARDPSTLALGELTVARSCEYRSGSPHLYKLPGRTSTGAALGGQVLAVAKLQYDSGTDVLVADANGNIKESSVSTTPTFSTTPVTGQSTTEVPQYTGFKNRWVRCNGTNDNLIREALPVPNGTQGNWRTVGMLPAEVPELDRITTGVVGSAIRPTTYVNLPLNLGLGETGYREAEKAFNAPGIGTGTVSGASGQTIVTGSGTVFQTELSVGTILTFSNGSSATVGSIVSNTSLIVEVNLGTTLAAGTTFTYTGSTVAPQPEATSAQGRTLGEQSHTGARTTQCTWKFTNNLDGLNRVLTILHSGAAWRRDPGTALSEVATSLYFRVEYSLNAGTSWTRLGQERTTFFPAPREDSVFLPDTFSIANNLWVRGTTFLDGHREFAIAHYVFDIKVSTGSSRFYSASNPIWYGVSEVYTDSDGVEHQSNMGTSSIGPLEIAASDLQTATSVVLVLPAKKNTLATKFIIWRSLDVPGGGYPTMYAIGDAPTTDLTWTDTLITRPDDVGAHGVLEQYKILEVLYSTGESFLQSFYSPPPLSFMTLPFQGCLTYFPSAAAHARRVYYSLPATVAISAAEQVPEQYYLDFQTPRNDQVKSGAIVNGGRSMLAFFENYTMLVNYLPQGADPGGFNNTVKEYVSNVRGCAGKFANTEFTLPSGQTLVASVDALGMWVTNGVNLVEEWTNDLDWSTDLTGVDLSTIELYDKPHKRRLEMLYMAADGTRKEYHFFYGRMKQGIDGKAQPVITGPHTSNTRCRHYTIISNKWEGFSGGSTSTGKVYLEDGQAADDSEGYDATGIVPWTVTSGDMYIGGMGKAHILESASVKFSDSLEKAFTLVGTFTRDAGTTAILTKTLGITFPQKVYFHQYADRHRFSFSDLTNTAAPAFIQYDLEVRGAGDSRDK